MKRRKSLKFETDPSQPKITKFFGCKRSATNESACEELLESSQEVLKADADSLNVNKKQGESIGNGSSSPYFGSESGDEFLSHVDIDGIVSSCSSQETRIPDVSGEWSDNSCGDELFSQISEGEMPGLSQTSSVENGSTSSEQTQPTLGGCDEDRHYHRNFWDVVNRVMSDSSLKYRFTSENQFIVKSLKSLSFDAQCLFIRLYQRKWNWIPTYKMKYTEFHQDLAQICRELTDSSFLEELSSTTKGITIEVVVDLLDLAGTISLTRKLGIFMRVGGKKTKEGCKDVILAEAKRKQQAVMEASLNELGPAFRVSQLSRTFFNGVYALHNKCYCK